MENLKINKNLNFCKSFQKWEKIWSWLYRNVFSIKNKDWSINNDIILKELDWNNIKKWWNPNNNEKLLYKYFEKKWINNILAKIFFDLSNNKFLVLEKLNTIEDPRDFEEDINKMKKKKFYDLIEKLKDKSTFNKDILNFIEWKNLSENKNLNYKSLLNFYFEEKFNEWYEWINFSKEFQVIYNILNDDVHEINSNKKLKKILLTVISDIDYQNIWYDNEMNIKILDFWWY